MIKYLIVLGLIFKLTYDDIFKLIFLEGEMEIFYLKTLKRICNSQDLFRKNKLDLSRNF